MPASKYTTKPMFHLCSQCNQEYPFTIEYFFKRAAGKYGLSTKCKNCAIENTKVWQAKNAEKTKEIKRNSRQKHKQRYTDEARQRYHQDEEYRLKRKAASDKWEAANTEKRNAAMRRRRKSNPKYKLQNRLAQQLRKENTSVTEQQLREMWDELQGRCAYCGISIFLEMERDVTIEHITPITRGGTGDLDNLTLACLPCNASKNNKTFEEWKCVRGW